MREAEFQQRGASEVIGSPENACIGHFIKIYSLSSFGSTRLIELFIVLPKHFVETYAKESCLSQHISFIHFIRSQEALFLTQ